MGNATSQRNITVVNDNLVPVLESQKTGETVTVKNPHKSTDGDKTSNEQVFMNRDVPPSKDVLMSQEEQLKSALAPYKKYSQKQGSTSSAMPPEQKVLLDCFKKNPSNSLICSREIQNFVNYVNKTSIANKSQP